MEFWIWLTQISGIGVVLQKRLLNYFRSPEAVYHAKEEELLAVEGIGTRLARIIQGSRSLEQAKAILEETRKQNIHLLAYYDPLYPSLAKEYEKAPTLLYYKGDLKTDSPGVAIVGSRRCTEYGKRAAVEAADFLAQHSIPVISGLAKGIDGYAHSGCVKAGGYTIAFLGNGIDICYPKEHESLMAAIIENGAVISQYLPNTRPRPEYFPERNALISSWSEKVFIVEAAEKSGALITAEIAKSAGKEVYALPHEIYNPTGRGVNRLISEGSHLYLHPTQLLLKSPLIWNELDRNNNLNETERVIDNHEHNHRTLTDKETSILQSLCETPKTIEEIGDFTKISQLDLIGIIAMMELDGMIQTCPGGRYQSLDNRGDNRNNRIDLRNYQSLYQSPRSY